jgi:hypothetical protein
MPALELLVHAEVAYGKHKRAHVALSELHRATCSVATDGVRAATRFAEGMVALGAGVLDAARSRLEEAAQLFERARARSSWRASTPGSTGPPGVHRQRWWSRNANACTAFPSGPTPPSSARPARRRGRPHQLRRSALLGSPHAGR